MSQAGGLRALSKEYVVEGSGETIEAALQAAFKVMRAEALKEAGQSVVYMEPDEVTVLTAEMNKSTERFLLLFWPREKRKFTIKFKIKVLMKIIDFSDIEVHETALSGSRFDKYRPAPGLFHPERK